MFKLIVKMREVRMQREASTKRRVASELGMTLLEIMIVLAIIAVVMGFLVGPKVINIFNDSKLATTKMLVTKIAHEAYTQWSSTNPSEQCPSSFDDLKKYRNSGNIKDGWGNEVIMLCGDNAPEGQSFAVLSKGKDGKQGTEDDIKSWE